MDNVLKLDEETLQKGWGYEGQYWFSVKDYSVIDIVTMVDVERPEDTGETEFMLSLGYIPFFRVDRLELCKSYIEAVASRKLKEKLAAVDDNDYIETFWKYFNAYNHLSDGYEEFTYNFLIKKAIDWCDDNNIKSEVI